MIYVAFVVVFSFALMFSKHERTLWGSGKTPFAFVVYPFLALLFIAVFIAPSLGFQTPHVETLLCTGLFFALFATASVSLRRVAGAGASLPPRLERPRAELPPGHDDHVVRNLEYLVLGGVLVLVFGATIASRDAGVVVKGELGVGGIGTHLIEAGVAYLVIAASEHRGRRLLRIAFGLLVLWLLAINQVKALIFLPLAAAILYRWVSGRLATWKVALLAIGAPLTLGVAVYAYFGAYVAAAGVSVTPAFVAELMRHMVGYLVAGILGLDQLLIQVRTVAFGASGLEYAFAPIVNLVRFMSGAGNYFIVVNPLYLVIHPAEMIDSNVFTVFGSLLYRGGWVGAVSITLAYALVSYWIWSRWRACQSAVACAAGSWWMAALLFTWFDPYFTSFTFIEIMVILSVRGSFRVPGFVGRAPRGAPEPISGTGY
jgi:Family of unknown function (DUF6337)